jgi:hypothetical protein
VADAIVKQILSGKGRQINLGADIGFLETARAWPFYISKGLGQFGRASRIAEVGKEQTGG